jgi:SAM-dependent methyltransferase
MRDHNKLFCELAAAGFDCPAPVYEFGSFQVEGQLDYADLRRLFPGKAYVGCDMREGPGVDRVEDVSALTLPDASAGTILCIETFEHVFEVRRAFDEVFRALRPGGLFLLTSPFNFRIHGYPDDYWRISPSCLRRMLEPYAARLVGDQGHEKFPHTVMSLAIKAPAPPDFAARAERFVRLYADRLRQMEASLPLAERLRRKVGQLYRSRGEKHQVADYYKARFTIDAPPAAALSLAG